MRINYKTISTFVVLLYLLFQAVKNNPQNAPQFIKATPTPKITSTPIVDDSTFYPVTKVVDGDTIDININGSKQTVRLIGLDTPEVVDPRKQVQCFGKEASAKAKELLNGKKVRLESDPTQGDRDKYNRLLRYIFLEDGTNINEYMIRQGYGHEYTYNLPYKYQDTFKQAEVYARTNKLGLWEDGVCSK